MHRQIAYNLAIPLILVALIFSVHALLKKEKRMSSRVLHISLSGVIKAPVTPENISTIPLYHLQYNIWDTLITSKASGAIARTFHANADQSIYTFKIDTEAKFSNGSPILAEDVKRSFDRLIEREENGHMNARGLIRYVKIIDSSTVEIALRQKTPSFLFVLSLPEFGILPRQALDENGNVKSLAVTSGAYSVENIDFEKQRVLLKRNTFFRRNLPSSAEVVELSFHKNLEQAEFAMRLGANDFYEFYNVDAEHVLNRAQEYQLKTQVTVPSLSVYLVSNQGMLTLKQSRAIAALFQHSFEVSPSSELERTSKQFLPKATFGSLAENEIPQIPLETNYIPKELIIKLPSLAANPVNNSIERLLSKNGIKVRFVARDSKESEHLSLYGQGMNTDFPEIELHLVTLSPYKLIEISDTDKELITNLMREGDDAVRSGKIKEVCRSMMSKGQVIPLATRAYLHLFNENRIDTSLVNDYDGDIPFYKIGMR